MDLDIWDALTDEEKWKQPYEEQFAVARLAVSQLLAKGVWGAAKASVANRFGEPVIHVFTTQESSVPYPNQSVRYYGFRCFIAHVRAI